MWFNRHSNRRTEPRTDDTPGLRAPARVRQLCATSPLEMIAEVQSTIATETELLASEGIAAARRLVDRVATQARNLGARALRLARIADRYHAEAGASGDGSVLLGILTAIGTALTVAAEFYFTRTTIGALLELEGLAADMLAGGATAAMLALELPVLRLLAAQLRRHQLTPRSRSALYVLVWVTYLACAAAAAELVLHTAPARAEAVKLFGDLAGSGGEIAEIDSTVVARFLGWLTIFVAGAAALLGATAHIELASAWARWCGDLTRWRLGIVEAKQHAREAEAQRLRLDLPDREQKARLTAQSWASDLRAELLQKVAPAALSPPTIDQTVDALLMEQLERRRDPSARGRGRDTA